MRYDRLLAEINKATAIYETRIDKLITAHQANGHGKHAVFHRPKKKKISRGKQSAAVRRATSKRMKKYWAERRAASGRA